MSNLRKVGRLLLFCPYLCLQACSPEAAAPPAPPTIEGSRLQSPEDMALQGFARNSIARKIKLDLDYVWENVDRKSGSTYACGYFRNPLGEGEGYYLAKAGDIKISWLGKYPENWEIYCAKR